MNVYVERTVILELEKTNYTDPLFKSIEVRYTKEISPYLKKILFPYKPELHCVWSHRKVFRRQLLSLFFDFTQVNIYDK